MRRLLPLLIILTASCSKPAPQDACNFGLNGDHQRITWGSNVPVVMYADASVPPEFEGAIIESMILWNQTAGHPLLAYGGRTTNEDQFRISYMFDWDAEKPNEQARTTIYWSGNRIYKANIRFNAKNFSWGTGTQIGRGVTHFDSVLIHELGHVLGLRHIDDPMSVMYPYMSNGTLRTELQSVDSASIRCGY